MAGESQYRQAVYDIMQREPDITTTTLAKRLGAGYSTVRIYQKEVLDARGALDEERWRQLLHTAKPFMSA